MTHLSMLELMPPEILSEIFQWVCWDEIDLNILAVSKSIRLALLSHPLVTTLAAFRIQPSKAGMSIVRQSRDPQSNEGFASTQSSDRDISITSSEILSRPWCHDRNLSQLQFALMRTMIRVYWTPYLRRDKRLAQPTALDHLLRQVTLLCQEGDQYRAGMRTLFDTVNEYSWTRLHIWPMDGRVLIRDQLMNASSELCVPIVSLTEAARSATVM